MPKLSAGLLVYRTTDVGVVEVLIVHPGGPFWAKKDDGAWSIPKGEYEEPEDPESVARREFEEELGKRPPGGGEVDLGELKQPSGKRIRAWAVEGNVDLSRIVSNTFEMEWPRGSGRTSTFPEVDRAAFMPVATARSKILKGQVAFLDRLMELLPGQEEGAPSGQEASPPSGQHSLFDF